MGKTFILVVLVFCVWLAAYMLFSVPPEIILIGIAFAVIGAVVMMQTLGPDLMRMLIFPFALVIAFFVYRLAGIEAAAGVVIVGVLIMIANPKPKGGYH